MKISNHIVASVVAGGVFYYFTTSITSSIMVFLSGVFIDIDHWIDYFISEGKINLDIKDFFQKCEGHQLKTSYLIFHSYEIVLLLWLISLFIKKNLYLTSIACGAGIHIVMDAIYKMHRYPLKPLAYSVLYRAFVMRFGAMAGCKDR